jgi:hypothetical protein
MVSSIMSLIRSLVVPAGLALFAAFFAFACAVAAAFPVANWDMLAYLALALRDIVPGDAALHAATYAAVEGAVRDGEFLVLTSDRPYRVAMAADPAGFMSMLPMYEVKWLYVEALRLLAPFLTPVEGNPPPVPSAAFGDGVLAAARLINVVSLAGLGLVGWIWLKRIKAEAAATGVVLLAASLAVPEIARATTPDVMAGVFAIGAVLAFAARRHAAAALLMALATLVRPDQAALGGLLALGLLVFERDWRNALLIFAPLLAAYLFASRVEGYPGWWAHVYFAQVEFVPTLADFDPPFSITQYGFALLKATVRAFTEYVWLATALGLALASAAAWAAGLFPDRRVPLALMLTFASTFGKMLAFPMDDGRIAFASVLAAGLLLAAAWPEAAKRLRSAQGAPITSA